MGSGAEVCSEVQQGLLPKWCMPVAAHGLYLTSDFLSDPSVGSCKMTLLLKLKSCAFGVLAPPSAGVPVPSPSVTIGSLGPCTPASPPDKWGNVQVRILGKSEHASFDDVRKPFGCWVAKKNQRLLVNCFASRFFPRLSGEAPGPQGAAAPLALHALAALRGGQLPALRLHFARL